VKPERSEGREVAKEKCHVRQRASPFGIEKACHFAVKASDKTRRADIVTAPDSSVTWGLRTDSTSSPVVLFCR
jgi:hypothetical protein